MTSGRVVLLGAPLGNAGDASARLREALATADIVAAEDTRRLHRLAKDLEVELTGKIVSYFEGNEERRTPELIAAAEDGATLAVITDGGMPSVSDPGFRLVRAALEVNLPVSVVPGPSAVTTALALSGLPCDRFVFEGFLPRKAGERRSRAAALATEERTLVLFEAPHRLPETLDVLVENFTAERPAAVCRELTKTYEEVRRGTLAELARWAHDGPVRGEITLVVGGAPASAVVRPDDARLAADVAEVESGGTSRRDAIDEVARRYGLPRREVYEVAVRTSPRRSPR